MIVRLLASLTLFVAASVMTALGLLVPGHQGLNETRAFLALGVGVFAVVVYLVQAVRGDYGAWGDTLLRKRRFSPWTLLMFAAFALFGLRSFCWLVFNEGNYIRIASPNNLGDLSLHMLLANYFANGVAWWPDHPQDALVPMRYYPGIDLFQSLLNVAGADEFCALTSVGLIGTAALALALREWGGGFAMAGFLFSGGLAGFKIFAAIFLEGTPLFEDYQGPLAWKSLPLAMFVTQRPFLFALPAGLLLMAHWRARFFSRATPLLLSRQMDVREDQPARGLIPFWVEFFLYAAMPFLHLFTFMFLSGLLGWWTVVYSRREAMRNHLLTLIGLALVPAGWQVYLMTGFSSGNIRFKPEWMCPADQSMLSFWLINFGLFLPLAIACWTHCVWPPIRAILEDDETGWTAAPPRPSDDGSTLAAEAFVIPSGIIFVLVSVFMLTVWEWDNTKVMIWCYLATLPFVWERWIAPLRSAARWPVCLVLFFSGFVCLIGGLKGDNGMGYELAHRDELDPVRFAVRKLPIEARFAAAPAYNHPLVFCGRKLAMGYEGHLYSQGLPYGDLEKDLRTLMLGKEDWGVCAGRLKVRYLYWGSREEEAYPGSAKPWEIRCQRVAHGSWGSIYDLQQSPQPQ